MTELLQRAFLEIQKLPEQEQDEIAKQLLAELEDEKAWQERFNTTTDTQWAAIAALARQDIASEQPLSLDEIFPVA
jgi:hypothetical protein